MPSPTQDIPREATQNGCACGVAITMLFYYVANFDNQYVGYGLPL